MTESDEAPLAEPAPASTDPASLSPVLLEEWQMRSQPFVDDPADGDYLIDEVGQQQIDSIKQELVSGGDLLLLTAPPGGGKSATLKIFTGRSGTRIQCFSVKGSQKFSTFQLFAGLLEAFKLTPPAHYEDAIKESIPCLQALQENNSIGVIVIDNADHIPDKELRKLLAGLYALNSGEETLLKLVLAVPPDFENRLPELLPQGAQIDYAVIEIEPLDIERSEKYLEFRLNQAGYFGDFPFDSSQLETIVTQAEGWPGRLNVLAADAIGGHLPDTGGSRATDRGLFQSRSLRVALGLAALGLIGAALLPLLPGLGGGSRPPAPDPNKFEVVSTNPVVPETPARPEISAVSDNQPQSQPTERIELLTETGPGSETGSQSATDQTDDSTPGSSTEPDSGDSGTEPPDSVPMSPEPVTPPAQTYTDSPDTSSSAATSQIDDAPTSPPASSPSDSGQQPEPMADSAPGSPAVLESANWVLVQDPEKYTIQLIASTDLPSVENFLKRAKLDEPTSIFSFKRNERVWYALVHGLFATISDARAAIEGMPEYAKSNQPWIRSIKQIQKAVKQ